MNRVCVLAVGIALCACAVPRATLALEIRSIEPTPLFPRPAQGQPLRQVMRLSVVNPGEPLSAAVRVTLGREKPETHDLAKVAKGASAIELTIPEVNAPTPAEIEIVARDGRPLATRKFTCQPQKKWTLYCVAYTHQDLGFGDYPHRLRTTIRNANIDLALRYCTETDDWGDDKYRFEIETAEPIPAWIGFSGKEKARELGRRIREGRIQVGGMHNTANTEQYSPELMARQFYLAGRHVPDLLGVVAGRTAQQTDVIGMPQTFPTYAREAGLEYFLHGINRLAMPHRVGKSLTSDFNALDNEMGESVYAPARAAAFFWQGPDGQSLLSRVTTYERHGLLDDPYERHPGPRQDPRRIEALVRAHEKSHWPLDCFLSQDGTDFILAKRMIADRARNWNARYAWPRLVPATLDMFFDQVGKEIREKRINVPTIAKDCNNQWSDQDATDARLLGRARRLGEDLPTAEKLAVLAQSLAGGRYPRLEFYQAYHRLMQYHEHTNAKSGPGSSPEDLRWYETELEENREMVAEAEQFQQAALADAQQRLNRVIPRTGRRNLVVFNPLPQVRTDVVRCPMQELPEDARLVDDATGAPAACQRMPDGSAVFIAANVPPMGWRVYRVEQGVKAPATAVKSHRLESRYYSLDVNPATGTITSLRDKELGEELVEAGAPHAMNEYLYQRFDAMNWQSQHIDRMKAARVSIVRGPVADVLTVDGPAPGVRRLRQTVTLFRDLKRIDFGLWVDKLPSGMKKEAIYVALPLRVPEFTIRHELPGAVVEPFRDQVEGSCTAHYAIRSFTDLSSQRYGVTVASLEGPLVCYGAPRPSPMFPGLGESHFDRSQEYPKKSRVYLYLMNNMFDVNLCWDQRGPAEFHWSLTSHSGDWRQGESDRFGRQTLVPLVAWQADGPNHAKTLGNRGFLEVSAPNVACSTLKAAEANGRGVILRLNETRGKTTPVTVSLPLLAGAITSVCPTNLVEDDRPQPLEVQGGRNFTCTLPAWGVKTFRIVCEPSTPPAAVSGLQAVAAADMQVDLSWAGNATRHVSHYAIYRDTDPKCEPKLLNLVDDVAATRFSDRPRLNYGGWIRNRLEPATTYYYRVVPIDRWNNPGPAGEVAKVTTLTPQQKNLPPARVECLRAVLVSPIARFNFVNLLFRTNCESDIAAYEIHRSTRGGFVPRAATLIGRVDHNEVLKGSEQYGHTPLDYPVKAFDHAMFADQTVESGTTYFYRVCAVDTAGQRGPFSIEAAVDAKRIAPTAVKAAAQSVYAPEYGPDNAVDGDPDPYLAWISKPYGGGTKEKPLDTWWQIELVKKPITIRGVTIVGDHRDVIPLQKSLQVQVREAGTWKIVGQLKDAATKDVVVRFAGPVTTDALRVFVPASDLPRSERADVDGIVRICELTLILPDGTETTVPNLFGNP